MDDVGEFVRSLLAKVGEKSPKSQKKWWTEGIKFMVAKFKKKD